MHCIQTTEWKANTNTNTKYYKFVRKKQIPKATKSIKQNSVRRIWKIETKKHWWLSRDFSVAVADSISSFFLSSHFVLLLLLMFCVSFLVVVEMLRRAKLTSIELPPKRRKSGRRKITRISEKSSSALWINMVLLRHVNIYLFRIMWHFYVGIGLWSVILNGVSSWAKQNVPVVQQFIFPNV